MTEKIYPTMVIRSQAEAIELLEKENKELKEENERLKINCNIGNENLTFYRNGYTQLKSVLKEIREYIKELYDNTDDTTCYDIDQHRKEFLLEIIDKGIGEDK